MVDPLALADRLYQRWQTDNPRWTEAQITLSEIPAPPFAEAARGDRFETLLRELGLEAITYDEVGNVYGRLPRSGAGPRLAVSAHLDTVFGPEVDCTVTRQGDFLRGPGISDDAAGLAMILALADGLGEQPADLPGELWVVATVGEENVGNLRGARHLAAYGVGGRPLDAFITLDTATPGHVIRHGTQSTNVDLLLHGPGGHAWGDYGTVNPAVVAARILARVSEYDTPDAPRTTINCGILESGTAPNAIPERARLHLNLRSESEPHLRRLADYAEQVIDQELARANDERRLGEALQAERSIAGRPGGETPPDSRLVRAAVAAAERLEAPVTHPYSSTDANAFMAAGIEAVCLYRGQGGGEHTLKEWYDASTRPEALRQLAETVLRYFAG